MIVREDTVKEKWSHRQKDRKEKSAGGNRNTGGKNKHQGGKNECQRAEIHV